MTKPATIWVDRNGTSTATAQEEGVLLLLETGFDILLETSFDILLEGAVVTVKPRTAWGLQAKQRTAWQMPDGASEPTAFAMTRITEQGDTRITEQGDTRIGEGNIFTPKPTTRWTT